MRVRRVISSLLLGLGAITVSAQEYPYQDQSLSPMERAADLVSRMTLEEKASQMVNMADAIPRLGVPSYRWWGECGHGVARSGNATMFPQNIGLAASFDEDLVQRMTSAIGDEARMLYQQSQLYGNEGKYTTLSFYSPSINIYRDPRWGRGQETFGEDPYLTGRMGVAYIKGLQGDDPKYLKAAACAKHFAAHSGPEEIKFGFGAVVEWDDLYETYLPAFKAAVQDGDVESVMGAYSMMNGEPGASSRFLLTEVLRDAWGFTGYTTSDCGAIYKLVSNGGGNKDTNGEGNFSVARSLPEACALALENGLNLECGGAFKTNLPLAVQQGFLSEVLLDQRLTELMASRFRLGLFDDADKVPYNDISPDIVNSKEHIDLAYETAVKSLVLLENKDNLLPLKKDVNYVYVTGPLGHSCDALIGNYYGASDKMTTFYEGISGRMPLGMSTQYRPGVLIDSKGYNDWTVKEAPEADVVVACIGLTNMFEGEGTDAIASQTKGDMFDLQIPEAQLEFVKTIRKNIDAKMQGDHECKLVVVVASGTPLILTELKEVADAIIYAWYPGQAGGYALADVLFGNVSPSGRAPMTFVKSLEQLPDFVNYEMTGRTYKYMTEEPLYPFGYGLSYADFAYSNLDAPKSVKATECATISVEVKNTSDIEADEIVQLYVSTEQAGIDNTPLRRLADFQRVSLKPNETKVVTLQVEPTSISLLKGDKQRVVESGEVKFSVGGGQPNSMTQAYVEGSYEVKGKATLDL
ncbi:MAG: glycoside hydrolase family 3 C-terminal domain-containing protein [Rikenellaceae bacterium]